MTTMLPSCSQRCSRRRVQASTGSPRNRRVALLLSDDSWIMDKTAAGSLIVGFCLHLFVTHAAAQAMSIASVGRAAIAWAQRRSATYPLSGVVASIVEYRRLENPMANLLFDTPWWL